MPVLPQGVESTGCAAQLTGLTADTLDHFSYRLPPSCDGPVAAREVTLVTAALVSAAMSSPATCAVGVFDLSV